MRDISPTQSPSHSRLSASEADSKDQPSANKLPELITIRLNACARAGLALSASVPGRCRSRSRLTPLLEIGSCPRSAFATWWQLLRFCSRFLRALFQFSKRAAGEATKFGRSGVEFLGVVGAACLECDEPAAEAGELIGRQHNFGDFFDFHVEQYSTAG